MLKGRCPSWVELHAAYAAGLQFGEQTFNN